MLTDKAKIDFEIYLKSNYNYLLYRFENSKTYLYDLLLADHIKKTDVLLNSVIIEWFESIGFHIGRDMIDKYWVDNSAHNENKAKENEDWTYDSISDLKSISEAIQKANELYNTTHP